MRLRIFAFLALILVVRGSLFASEKSVPTVRVALVFNANEGNRSATRIADGAVLAARSVNEDGRIKVIHNLFNSGDDAAGTANAMDRAVKWKPDVILAEIDSSKAFVAAKIAEANKIPMITPFATSPRVTEGRKFVFRACFADDFQGSALAKYALNDLAAKKIGIIADASQLYSQTLADEFVAELKRNGTNVEFREDVLTNASNLGPVLKRLSGTDADLIFLPVYESFAARVVGSFMEKGNETNKRFLGGDGWGTGRYFKELVFDKKRPFGAYWVTHFADFLKSPEIDRATVEMKKWLDAQGKVAGGLAIGYDSMKLVEKVYLHLGKSAPTALEIAQGFREMKPHNGLTGVIHFAGSQSPRKSLFISKVGEGKPHEFLELKP